MPVTEFALLHLTHPALTSSSPSNNHPSTLPPAILPILRKATAAQQAWHAAAFPDLPSTPRARAAAWFVQLEDPTWVLTTAIWPSVAAHWDWIRSADNRRVMDALEGEGHVVKEDTVLWHVRGVVFDGAEPKEEGVKEQRLVTLLESPIVSVGRVTVAREKKNALTAMFERVKGVLENYANPREVRYGWREEIEHEDYEEFALVCGWESLEQRAGFARAPGFDEYNKIRELTSHIDLKHYRRVSLE